MKEGHRLIFRDAAMQRYALGRTRSVLPQFTSLRVRTLLWVIAGMLLSSGLLAWLIHIPVYASGLGMVIESPPLGAGEVGDVRRMAVVLADKEASRVRVGQKVFWSLDTRGTRVSLTLIAIETEVSSLKAVYERFKLTGAAAAGITEPVVVAFVDPEALPDNVPASPSAGNLYRIDVEVGTIRAISMLPFISGFSLNR
jgi:hypothetical protein